MSDCSRVLLYFGRLDFCFYSLIVPNPHLVAVFLPFDDNISKKRGFHLELMHELILYLNGDVCVQICLPGAIYLSHC